MDLTIGDDVSDALTQYEKITAALAARGAAAGQMFGKPCLKLQGNAFAAFHQDGMAFKLQGAPHASALKLDGCVLWDPSGKGRPMKEWVYAGPLHAKKWPTLAEQAMDYVGTLPPK